MPPVRAYELELGQEGELLALRVQYTTSLTPEHRLGIYFQLGTFAAQSGDAVQLTFKGDQILVSLPVAPNEAIEEEKFIGILNVLGINTAGNIPIRVKGQTSELRTREIIEVQDIPLILH